MVVQPLEQLAKEQFGDYDNSRLLDIHSSSKHPEMKAAYELILSDVCRAGEMLKGKTQRAMAGYTWLILCNCIAGAFHGSYIVVCRKASSFSPGTRYGNLGIRRIPFLLVLDRMVECQWLEITIGHPSKYNQFNDKNSVKTKGQLTRIRPTEKLLKLFPTLTVLDVTYNDDRLVVVKDEEGMEVKFDAKSCPVGLLDKLAKINHVLAGHEFNYQPMPREVLTANPYRNIPCFAEFDSESLYEVLPIPTNTCINESNYSPNVINYANYSRNSYGNGIESEPFSETPRQSLFPRLQAIYNRSSFNFGGRLFCNASRGEDYQQLSPKARATIRIDGEPTVEYDFHALHISMLYAMEGIQLDQNADPYVGLDRPIAKRLLLTAINGASIKQVVKSMRHEERKLLRKEYLKKRDLKFLDAAMNREQNWEDEIDKLKAVHKPIASWFCSDSGIKLMTMDAIIIMEVVHYFALQGIPALPVHDSVIIAERYEYELKRVMEETYSRNMNGFHCEAEKKD